MNEPEVRALIHAAFGEATYPAAMTERVARRLSEPAGRSHARLYGFVAAALAVLLVAALVMTRFELPRTGTQSEAARAVAGPVDPNAKLPDADLNAAGLSGPAVRLVTPLNLAAESQGHRLALIGAYADTSEIALFFRSTQGGAMVQVQVYDRTGLLNYGSSGANGIQGDIVFVLGGGARAGSDGLAHLNVIAGNLQMAFDSPPVPGTWSFSIAIKVQEATPLTMSPPLRASGSWKFKVEAFEATPAVVRFQAAVDGVPIQEVGVATITIVDASGAPVQPRASSTELIGQRFLFLTFGDRPTRLILTWTRPAAGDYVLVITGHGIAYRGTVTIPPYEGP